MKKRLEELRQTLRDENMSYGELIELQSLIEFIEPGDVELLEAAGVPEFNEDSVICDVTGETMDEGYVVEGMLLTHIKYKEDLIKFFRQPSYQNAIEEDVILSELSDEELLEFLGENDYYYWTTWYENEI